ncbi:MAG: hypothetical protein MZW92_05735 [Comamonadaceae bacterium]|nr:hypothetical protein [Comamonadaceae bacterium]
MPAGRPASTPTANGAAYRFEGRGAAGWIAKAAAPPGTSSRSASASPPGALAAECDAGSHDQAKSLAGASGGDGHGRRAPSDPRRARPLLEPRPRQRHRTRLHRTDPARATPRTRGIPAAPDRAERDQRNLGLRESGVPVSAIRPPARTRPTCIAAAAHPIGALLEQMAVGPAAGQQPVWLPPPVVRDLARARALMRRACELDLDSARMDLGRRADALLGTRTAAMPDTNDLATALPTVAEPLRPGRRGGSVPSARPVVAPANPRRSPTGRAPARWGFSRPATHRALRAAPRRRSCGRRTSAAAGRRRWRSKWRNAAAGRLQPGSEGCQTPADSTTRNAAPTDRPRPASTWRCSSTATGLPPGSPATGRELLEKACRGGEARACGTLRTMLHLR